jgi:FolB domain-containing protein
METDFTRAIQSDDLTATIDYYAVTQRLRNFGTCRSWRLIEKLVGDIAESVLHEFKATAITVEVKKFIIPETRYVSVKMGRRA